MVYNHLQDFVTIFPFFFSGQISNVICPCLELDIILADSVALSFFDACFWWLFLMQEPVSGLADIKAKIEHLGLGGATVDLGCGSVDAQPSEAGAAHSYTHRFTC